MSRRAGSLDRAAPFSLSYAAPVTALFVMIETPTIIAAAGNPPKRITGVKGEQPFLAAGLALTAAHELLNQLAILAVITGARMPPLAGC